MGWAFFRRTYYCFHPPRLSMQVDILSIEAGWIWGREGEKNNWHLQRHSLSQEKAYRNQDTSFLLSWDALETNGLFLLLSWWMSRLCWFAFVILLSLLLRAVLGMGGTQRDITMGVGRGSHPQPPMQKWGEGGVGIKAFLRVTGRRCECVTWTQCKELKRNRKFFFWLRRFKKKGGKGTVIIEKDTRWKGP